MLIKKWLCLFYLFLLDNKGGNSQTFEGTLLVDIFIMLSSYTKINDTNDFYNPPIIRRKQY